MGRPKKDPKELKDRLHVTLEPGLKNRYQALQAVTGLDLSYIVESALLQMIEAFEKDPREILKPQDTTSGPSGIEKPGTKA